MVRSCYAELKRDLKKAMKKFIDFRAKHGGILITDQQCIDTEVYNAMVELKLVAPPLKWDKINGVYRHVSEAR